MPEKSATYSVVPKTDEGDDMNKEEYEIRNAIIEDISFSQERGFTIFVHLNYGSARQGFGGYQLYVDIDDRHNWCGHFMSRLFQIAGVSDLKGLKGKTVRVKASSSNVKAIGHIVKDDWFDPAEEFQQMTENDHE